MERRTPLIAFCHLCLIGTFAVSAQEYAPGPQGSVSIPHLEAGTVPRLVGFAGILKDETGKPRSGPVALTFSIYAEQDSRTPLWQESQNAQADEQGHYTVHLGAAAAGGMPLDLFTSGRSLWLGVQPQLAGVPEQARVLLVSVPYALKAADSDSLGGRPASAFVTADSLESAAAGATAGGEKLATSASVNQRRAAVALASVGGSGTPNAIPIWTDSANLGNSVLSQSGINVGIGTTTAAARLQLIADAPTTRTLIVEGAASQSANLQEWQNRSGTTLASVNSGGGAFFPAAGIGSNAPQTGTALYVRQAFGNPGTTTSTGMSVYPSIAPTAANSDYLYGGLVSSSISGAVGTGGQIYGALAQGTSSVATGGTVGTLIGGRFIGINNGTGATTNLYGGYFNTYNQGGGTATSQFAGYFYNVVSTSSKVTNLFGNYIGAPNISGGGAVTNAYGLYLQNVAGATGTNYAIYSAGGTSYLAGNVGVGTATPAAKLEVNGTAKFDGLITFAPGQTFPGGGGGTITGVTAGTALTGGGTSGAVTLNLDVTKVPRLAAANTFTATQTINGDVNLTGSINGALTITNATGCSGACNGVNIVAGFSGNSVTPGVAGATISGGGYLYGGAPSSNSVSGNIATVSGGTRNIASGWGASVGGGESNTASGFFSTVTGGDSNRAEGTHSIVAGGAVNTAGGINSFAAGASANALDDGSFVWCGRNGDPCPSFGQNSFQVSVYGPIYFLDGSASSGEGCALKAGTAGWSCSSDRNLKDNIVAIDSRAVAEGVAHMPISQWAMKADPTRQKHIGPMAQDFYAAFGLGDSDRYIAQGDAQGVALAAIQGLYEIVQEKELQIKRLRQENDEHIRALTSRLEALEERLTESER